MSKMDKEQLYDRLSDMYQKSIHFDDEFISKNETIERKMHKELSEFPSKKNRSSIISSDMYDQVKSDMTSLDRIFNSPENSFKFNPVSSNIKHIREAEEKEIYVNHVLNNIDEDYLTISDWMETGLYQSASILKVYISTEKKPFEEEYENVTDSNITEITKSFEDDDKVTDFRIIEKSEEEINLSDEEKEIIKAGILEFKAQTLSPEEIKEPTDEEIYNAAKEFNDAQGVSFTESKYTLTVSYIKEVKKFNVVQIPLSNFIAPLNARSRSEAPIIGDISYQTRGELKVMYPEKKDLIDSLKSTTDDTKIDERKRNTSDILGGSYEDYDDLEFDSKDEDLIEVLDLYALIDYDGDGVAERRHVVIAGDKVINEPEIFDHIPYPILSSVGIPNSIFGKSRAELLTDIQEVNTELYRGMIDNIKSVNNTSYIVNSNVNLSDLSNNRYGSIIRTKSENNVSQDVQPFFKEYTADKTQMVMQYIENRKAQTTGNMISNQGLTSDSVNQETATRFEGIKDAGAAKLELVARRYAETGFKHLAETIIFLAKEYMDEEEEILYNDEMIKIDPSKWTTECKCKVSYEDKQKTLEANQGLLAMQLTQLQLGLPTVDARTIYNVNAKIMKSLGEYDVKSVFNNPEIPEEVALSELTKAQQIIEQLQAQVQQNPLAEAETIKAQAGLVKAESDKQVDIAKLELENKKLEQEFQLKLREMEMKEQELALKITELELKANKDLNSEIKDNSNI